MYVSLTEVVGQLSAADLLRFLAKLQCMLGNVITRDVRCHDEDGIFTFDGLPLTVCEATLREEQQEQQRDHLINVTLVNETQDGRDFTKGISVLNSLCTHLIEELQHDSENIRMGLVYFIKQDNGVGTRLQQLGQLTPLLMSHVSRRGADELRHLRGDGVMYMQHT